MRVTVPATAVTERRTSASTASESFVPPSRCVQSHKYVLKVGECNALLCLATQRFAVPGIMPRISETEQ